MVQSGKTKEMDMLHGGLAGKLIFFRYRLLQAVFSSSFLIRQMWRS